jgi:transposase
MDEELGNEQWDLIAPLLPQPKGRGRPRAEDQRTLVRQPVHLPPATPRVATPGSLERHPVKILSNLDAQAKLDWN